MSLNLGMFQIALMLFAPLIPLIYCLKWRRESLRKVIIIFICCNLIVIVIGYRITVDLGKIIEPILGYFTGKFILFTLFPLLVIWRITDLKVAYSTSVSAFILAQPSLIIVQGILWGIITYKTKNLIGSWISHGLNQVIPSLISTALGI